MEEQKLREQIESILEHDTVGPMATVKANKPHSRYMTFYHENLQLFTATSKETHKVEEMKDNPYTHIILGYNGEGFGDAYVEYEGKVSVNDSASLKEKLWNESMKQWFKDADDPNYMIIEITPVLIRLMNKNTYTPQTLYISKE
ncbi:pyridoxamine 5'-phosphate oxidase family protein [Virgibacillus sp. W0430]|uniref:pyridoxamine 5'-phosphate oxidase family protein n=1 Tax=Virgibacillus sp. W0430 TaxID=3391580 RepID=UPI003F45E16B